MRWNLKHGESKNKEKTVLSLKRKLTLKTSKSSSTLKIKLITDRQVRNSVLTIRMEYPNYHKKLSWTQSCYKVPEECIKVSCNYLGRKCPVNWPRSFFCQRSRTVADEPEKKDGLAMTTWYGNGQIPLQTTHWSLLKPPPPLPDT